MTWSDPATPPFLVPRAGFAIARARSIGQNRRTIAGIHDAIHDDGDGGFTLCSAAYSFDLFVSEIRARIYLIIWINYYLNNRAQLG